MYHYSAIVPSRDLEHLKLTIPALVENSINCDEVLIYWNGRENINDILDLFQDTLTTVRVINAESMDVYEMYNTGAGIARCENVLFINDDMFVPPGWDFTLDVLGNPPFNTKSTIVTFTLIEPGYVDVNSKCVHMDFGQTIPEFKQKEFETLARKSTYTLGNGLGWYMPVIFPKDFFLRQGGYPTDHPFPYPNDIAFFDKIQRSNEASFIKVDSAVYHFQRLSQRPDKMLSISKKVNLCCGSDIRDGYINMDTIVGPQVMQLDLEKDKLPFADQSIEEILWRHAIEHFRFEVVNNILIDIKRVLKDGGFVDIYTPEMAQAMEDYLIGYNAMPNCCDPMMRLWGLGTGENQIHKSGFTNRLPRGNHLGNILLKGIGFSRVEELPCQDNDEFGIRVYK